MKKINLTASQMRKLLTEIQTIYPSNETYDGTNVWRWCRRSSAGGVFITADTPEKLIRAVHRLAKKNGRPFAFIIQLNNISYTGLFQSLAEVISPPLPVSGINGLLIGFSDRESDDLDAMTFIRNS